MNWNALFVNDSRDVNSVFSSFYNKFNKLINRYAPIKQSQNVKQNCYQNLTKFFWISYIVMAFVVLQINGFQSSFLEDRTKTTQIGSFISPEKNITFGVPQGSVLGPLLFVIYINDTQEYSEKLQFFLFADDTNIPYADNNLKSLEDIVNLELRKLCDWLTANKFTLNIKKKKQIRHILPRLEKTHFSTKYHDI